MRCNNCGWMNAENEQRCIKCNTVLVAISTVADERKNKSAKFAGTLPGAPVPDAGREKKVPVPQTNYAGENKEPEKELPVPQTNYAGENKEPEMEVPVPQTNNAGENKEPEKNVPVPQTNYAGKNKEPEKKVPVSQTNNAGENKKPEQEAHPLLTCPWPDCGYIYPRQATVCPRCQRPFIPGKTAAPVPGTIPPAAAPFTGTIDPYRNTAISGKQTCRLQMADAAGNGNEAGPSRFFTFEQAPVALNRDNLDPGNPHITGKVQAMLWYEDGQWFLEDKSELQTTFLLIREKKALKAGDIIVMGDRKFIFNPVD